MTLTVKKVCRWETSDGVAHPTKAIADQYILNHDMAAMLADVCQLSPADAQDILNCLSGRSQDVRDWLDANDHAMRVAQGQEKDRE